jgi:hypothetical protein
MNRIIAAAALTAALWALIRWLARRRVPIADATRDPTETWENEGGALSLPYGRVRAFRCRTVATGARGRAVGQAARRDVHMLARFESGNRFR